jgi:hypothetical protein
MPDLVQVAKDNAKNPLDVLLLSYDLQGPRPDPERVVARLQKFVCERGWNLPVYVFDAPDLDALGDRFDLPGSIPVTLAFDKEGRLVDREDGPSSKLRFEMLVQRALAVR